MMMNKILIFIMAIAISTGNLYSQNDAALIKALTDIDPELKKLFPRWKVCEADLQVQIYKSFELLGYDKSKLSMQEIEVLAAPRRSPLDPYEILLITCGKEAMKSNDLERDMGTIVSLLSGEYSYNVNKKEIKKMNIEIANGSDKEYDMVRAYCYTEIPPELPVNPSQATAIQDYMKPSDKNQAFVISLFEQSLKIGESGFWLNNKLGNEEIGYPFYTPGEAKITIKRPLYINEDVETRESIPYLVNFSLGGVYKINSGLDNSGSLFGWLPERTLNTMPGGKLKVGADIHLPIHPNFGLTINAEIPMQSLSTQGINPIDWGRYQLGYSLLPDDDSKLREEGIYYENEEGYSQVLPILRANGQVSLFYNLWVDENRPENFFRFDLGVSYNEVAEYLQYIDSTSGTPVTYITNQGVAGLTTYRNMEFEDWIYFKVDYRNQSVFPFGVSLQYSNQILLAKGFVPLFGNWLLLEAKLATPLRDLRPYETGTFFMISPILRITI